MKKNLIVFTSIIMFTCALKAQVVINPDTLSLSNDDDNICVVKLEDTKDASSFLIRVRDEVPPHYHENHTEHVYVIEGRGIMLLNDELIEIGPGHIISLPPGTVHAVKRKGDLPLKVLSVQSPQFNGSERTPTESPLWPTEHE